jgi:hypothetical protein
MDYRKQVYSNGTVIKKRKVKRTEQILQKIRHTAPFLRKTFLFLPFIYIFTLYFSIRFQKSLFTLIFTCCHTGQNRILLPKGWSFLLAFEFSLQKLILNFSTGALPGFLWIFALSACFQITLDQLTISI